MSKCTWCKQPLSKTVFYALDGYQNEMESLGCFCSEECMERGIVDRYGLGALAEPEVEYGVRGAE